MEKQAIPIEKELIDFLVFPTDEVLRSNFEKEKRMKALQRVTTLGNVFRQKVKIFFEDIGGLKLVETTVWNVDARMIELKNRVMIPINRIREIVLY